MAIVKKMIPIVSTARSIYKTEALSYIRVTVNYSESLKSNYVEVESMGVDSEFLDSWQFVKITPSEVESAIKIVQMINFKGERVSYLSNGIELYVRRSPRIRQVEESIYALRCADFYSELHQEESCSYSVILKDTQKAQKELKAFLKKYDNVSCYYEYGIYSLYM